MFLTRFYNFINRYCKKYTPCDIKKNADKFILAWVPADDPPAGSICIRRDNNPDASQYYEYVIPVLYLKSGDEFIHKQTDNISENKTT